MRRMQTFAFVSMGLRLKAARHSRQSGRRQSGFTMIELMVTIALMGVLATLAAPRFTQMIERWRVRQAAENMVSSLYYARSEAIKRGGGVIIYKLQRSGDAACAHATANNNWGCGWAIAYDKDRSGTFNSGDELLQESDAPARVNVIVRSSATALKFDRWGQSNGIGSSGIIFTPASGNSSGDRAIAVCTSSGGRIDMKIGELSC